MSQSTDLGKLAEALSKAQGAMRHATKDRQNPFFKSSYATLASVIEAIREPFAANGLAFSQLLASSPDGVLFTVSTVIMHSSGQWLSSDITAKPVKADPQGIGSLISYLKRYGLQAMVGVTAAEDDDDGNEASNRPTQKPSEHDGAWAILQEAVKVVKAHGGDPAKIIGKTSIELAKAKTEEIYAAAEILKKWRKP